MRRLCAVAAIIILITLCGCSVKSPAISHGPDGSVRGVASWYGPGYQGRTTANGEKFNMNAMTAAHKKLPFGTRVRVTNLANGKKVVVRINDRGPFIKGRIIDLSREGARRLGFMKAGLAEVKLEILRS
jgi:rare lipoprotein A